MNALEVIQAVRSAGGSLVLRGDRIEYVLPESASWLVDELAEHKKDLIPLLEKASVPLMPAGMRLLRWRPKDPPIGIVRTGVVTEVHKFIQETLLEVSARIRRGDLLAGSCTLRELIEKLEQVGVEIEVQKEERVDK